MVVEDVPPVLSSATHGGSNWRLPPIRRMGVVGLASAAVSMVWHVAVARTDSTLGEALFPVPFGGFSYIVVAIPVGVLAIGLVLAMLRVGDAAVVWVVGGPFAVGGGLLAATGLKILNAYRWEDRWHVPGWLTYGLADSVGVAVAYMLAAVVTDGRLPARVRVLVPATVLVVVIATWAIVYNFRY